jgi:hypothetical protein
MRKTLVVAVLVSSGIAAADPMSVGFRIGGYGFRREATPEQPNDWTQCRMNGVGVFATRTVRGPLFIEAGLDAYSSQQPEPQDLPIDRQSALLTTAIGVRSNIVSWLAAYAQLGVGAELTRVAVPYGDASIAANKVMPDGFLGVGGELQLGKTHVGAIMRTFVMGNFNYDPQRLQMTGQWSQPSADQVFDATPALAAEGQFYVRRDL